PRSHQPRIFLGQRKLSPFIGKIDPFPEETLEQYPGHIPPKISLGGKKPPLPHQEITKINLVNISIYRWIHANDIGELTPLNNRSVLLFFKLQFPLTSTQISHVDDLRFSVYNNGHA